MQREPDRIPDRELIEAVRPERDGADDPFVAELLRRLESQPSLAPLLRDSQQFDAELTHLLGSVPPRPGLEERILARLASETLLPSAPKLTTSEGKERSVAGAKTAAVRLERTRQPSSRRRWLVAVASGACALGLGGLGWWFLARPTPRRTLKATELANAVARVFEQTLNEFGTGRSTTAFPPPPVYQLSKDIRLFPGASVSWRSVVVMEREAIAFDMTQPGGEQGTLFTLLWTVDDLPQFPPYVPQLQTSRSSLGWWRDGQVSYVLAVLGGPKVYQRFLRPPRPIT